MIHISLPFLFLCIYIISITGAFRFYNTVITGVDYKMFTKNIFY